MATRQFLLMAGAALAVAIGWLYGRGFDAPALFDDADFFASHFVSTYGASIQPLTFRYWPYASFAHEKLLLGHDLAAMRLGNVVLHLLCMLVLQRLLAMLLAAVGGTADAAAAFRRELAAGTVAALFAFHPVAVYAVAYLVQRSMLMATLFSLFMLISLLRGFAGGRPAWYGLAALCFYFAVFSKEHAILMPAVAAALVVLMAPRGQVRILLAAFLGFAVIMALAALRGSAVAGHAYEPMLIYGTAIAGEHERLFLFERIHWLSILTQGRLFFKYLALWLWPNGAAMSVDMREEFPADLTDPAAWLGLVAYTGVGIVALACLLRRGRIGLVGFGLLTTWLLFGLEMATVRLQEPFVLYRSYLWMVGLAVVLAVGVESLSRRVAAGWVAAAAVTACVALAWSADGRLSTFASAEAMWGDAVRLVERRALTKVQAERAYNNRGVARAERKDYAAAIADFDRAIGYNAGYYPAYFSRAQSLAAIGRDDAALADLDRVLAIRRDFMAAHLSRAAILHKLGRTDEATAELKRVCDAGNAMACWMLRRQISTIAPKTWRIS